MPTIRLTEPHVDQQTILAEAKRFNVLNCGRRYGKTTLGQHLIISKALQGYPVGWWSPTYKMLSEVWTGLKDVLSEVIVEKSEQENKLRLVTGGVIDMWSMENVDNARGRYYGLAVIDEAAMVPGLVEAFEQVIRPTLIDMKGDAWFMSTPKGRNGFYQFHLRGRDPDNAEWKSWTRTSYCNPHIPASELDAMRDSDSELSYQQEIMAEFLEGSGIVFRNLDVACTLEPSTPTQHAGHTLVAGVDWGKINDFTSISIGCANCAKEVYLDRFNVIDYYFQRKRLEMLWHTWNIRSMLVELNSIGEANFEDLHRSGLPVLGFKTTPTSKTPLIEGLALTIEKNSIQLLKHPVAYSELEAYEVTVNPHTGRTSYSAPNGFNDDTVIARALMWRQMESAIAKLDRSRKRRWQGSSLYRESNIL